MRFVFAWFPVALLEAAVLFLSSRPGGSITIPFGGIDKVFHFGEYFALAFCVYRALRISGGRRGQSVLGTSLLVALLALGDEVFQSRIPGRDASILDWFADLLGMAVGVWSAARAERALPLLFSGGPRGRVVGPRPETGS